MEYKDVQYLLNKNHMRIADLARKTGIPYSTFTDWKAGRYTPKHDKIQKVADCFGVPVDFDCDVIMEFPAEPMLKAMEIVNTQKVEKDQQERLIRLFKKLIDKDRDEIMRIMEMKV